MVAGCGDDKPSIVHTDGGDSGGGDGGSSCPTGSFLRPAPDAILTANEDADGGQCGGNGLVYSIVVAANVPDGTPATLFVGPGGSERATVEVEGASATFQDIDLGLGGAVSLAVQLGNDPSCLITSTVTVDCGVPTCSISRPDHDVLNGVPVDDGGDRVSSQGSDYQVAFEVETDIADGQPVSLRITRAALPGVVTTVNATAQGGKASFAGVTLMPDDTYTVSATCTSGAGVVRQSEERQYAVDTMPPVLAVSSPADGQHFDPDQLTGDAFQVCASTTSADAADLPESLGTAANNLCAAIGAASVCAPVTSGTEGRSGCVNVPCPGGAPFNLTVTLRDSAGNPVETTVTGVTCSSTLPGVVIASPPGDTDPANSPAASHLLSAGSGQTLRDLDSTRTGAQQNVVACTDRALGMATLYAGQQGGTLSAIAGPVAVVPAEAADSCPSGFAYAARFPNVTIPESVEAPNGSLQTATQLRVDVIDESSTTGASLPVNLWVDSSAPTVAPSQPTGMCTLRHQSATDWATAVQLVSTTPDVTLTVTGPLGATTYPAVSWTSNTFANFGSVTFAVGANEVTATATDKAGNAGTLVSPCTVIVGTAPEVAFTAPAVSDLCANGTTGGCLADTDATTPDWQGSIAVSVVVNGAPATTGTVTFGTGATTLGTADIVNGIAALPNATLPQGAAVPISATTSEIGTNGSGSASTVVRVDTIAPDAITTMNPPEITDRRQTTFHLSWTAPADSGAAVARYLVKTSRAPIDAASFDAAETIAWGGTAGEPGATNGLDVPNRLIETEWYFAVAPVDAVGNRGPITSAGPAIAHFESLVIPAPAGSASNEQVGFSIDGSADFNRDGRSDILVGSLNGQNAYVFYGAATPTAGTPAAPTTPSVTITGPAASAFGRAFSAIGDIDADGLEDFAVGAPTGSPPTVYIYKGRTTAWTSPVSAATYTLTFDASYAATFFGQNLIRLGDFNGDGVDDFAISSHRYGGTRGRVVVVLGRAGFSADVINTMTFDGESTEATGQFGTRIVGLGRFYTGGQGTTMVVSATAAAASAGRVYAIPGQAGTTGAFAIGTAPLNSVDSVTGPFASAVYGNSLWLLGPVSTTPGVIIGSTYSGALGHGFADLFYGTTNPLAGSSWRFNDSAATAGGDSFSRVAFGTAFSGSAVTTSLIGDSHADVVILPYREGGTPPRAYIVDGTRLASITAPPATPANIVTSADVILTLPTGWVMPFQRSGAIKDLNGDGYGDLAFGNGTGSGGIVVFW